jgi:hypothetical protein
MIISHFKTAETFLVAVRKSGFGGSLLTDKKTGKACLSYASVKTALSFCEYVFPQNSHTKLILETRLRPRLSPILIIN